jgi:DNA (cytosine-5)-methyltransferase 1
MNLKIPQATSKGYIEVKPYGAFDALYINSKTRRGRVQGDGGDISPTIMCTSEILVNMAEEKGIMLPAELKGKKFRIRKLTPRECFRLMGVDDKDIDKIQAAGVSNSGQYKLAGNSIVVDVLFHIFRKMFIEPDQPDINGTPTQLTIW